MSLLRELIRSLNDEEIVEVQLPHYTHKERALLHILIDSRFQTEFNKMETMKALEVSSSHFDKLCAVVLKKTYQALAGNDELQQLVFLNKKNLYNHLFHEIKHFIKIIESREITQAERESYFYVFFNLSVNVPAKYYDEEFGKHNAQIYLAHVVENRTDKEMEVEAKLLFARMNLLMQQPPDEREIRKIKSELLLLEKKFIKVKLPDSQTVLFRVFIIFYTYLSPNSKKRIAYLEKISNLYGGFHKMPEFEKALTECHVAEGLFESGKYQEAFMHYRQTFDQYAGVLKNQYHHIVRIAELAMILGDLPFTEQLLKKNFSIHIQNNHESYGVQGSILYAQLHLLGGHPNRAFEYIHYGKLHNSMHIYFKYDVKLRMLENSFFSYIGDYKFAEHLALKNLRYLQSRKLSLKKYPYAYYFIVLRELKSIRKNGGKVGNKLMTKLQEFSSGFDRLWGVHLQELVERTKLAAAQQ